MNDETLKEHIELILSEYKIGFQVPPEMDINKHLDGFTQSIMQLIKEDRERAVKNAYNNARYTLHSILSNDVDSELDHSDVEAKFMAQLSNPTQENTTVYNIAGGDEYKIMGEKVTGVNTLTVHDLDKPNQAQEKESDD